MSRGKYSVLAYVDKGNYSFTPKGLAPEPIRPGESYDPKRHLGGFDDEGYDMYGYSCYDRQGNWVGDGNGVDRAGWTEMDYLTLQDIPEEHRNSYYFFNS